VETISGKYVEGNKIMTQTIARLLERLGEMFPGSDYQSRLDSYLSTKGITDTAQLETYIRQYQYSQKETYL
jgi:hypothetical protein